MSREFKSDVELARLIPSAWRRNPWVNGDLWIDGVFRSCQGNRGDEGFWLLLVSNRGIKLLPLLKYWAPPSIVSCHMTLLSTVLS